MLDEVQAEAKAGFLGGKVAPWKRSIVTQEPTRREDVTEIHRAAPTPEEIEAKLVEAVAAHLLERPAGDETKPTTAVEQEKSSTDDTHQSDDVGAVLAKAIADILLPDADAPAGSNGGAEAASSSTPSRVAERIRRAFRRAPSELPKADKQAAAKDGGSSP
jgi:hypothetical protein